MRPVIVPLGHWTAFLLYAPLTGQQLTTSTREGLSRCLRPLGAGTRFVRGQAINPFRRRTHDHGPTVAMNLWTRRTEDLDGDTTVVARLLERAQCGEHDEALRLAENALKEPTGDLADGEAGMHFVRFVALVVQGRSSEAMGAIDLMLASADHEGSQGWRSCALSGRAYQRLMIGEQLADHDVDAVLQDLVDAEIALGRGVEDSVIAENAHTGVALGYHQLRLYELALPQYEAAYAVSPQDGRQTGNRAMWQSNIATLHLEWALELYRVRQVAEAEQHSLAAGAHAALAAEQARGPDTERWRQHAHLLAACAAADGPDPAGAARSIERYAAELGGRGQRIEVAFCWPFLAVALSRSGEPERLSATARKGQQKACLLYTSPS